MPRCMHSHPMYSRTTLHPLATHTHNPQHPAPSPSTHIPNDRRNKRKRDPLHHEALPYTHTHQPTQTALHQQAREEGGGGARAIEIAEKCSVPWARGFGYLWVRTLAGSAGSLSPVECGTCWTQGSEECGLNSLFILQRCNNHVFTISTTSAVISRVFNLEDM